MKIAVVTGASGQSGSYMSDLLLENGYKVVAIQRRAGSRDNSNIEHILPHPRFIIEQGDLTDFGSLSRIVQKYLPDEFYNFAAMSYVGASWDEPISCCAINTLGVANCLESIRLNSPKTKFFQASTSEVYGRVTTPKQDETTESNPRSPYGASKLGAEALVKVYRESYGLFAFFARSFNHESERRGKQFVTRKISDYVGKLYNFKDDGSLKLGNIDTKRDFSHAKDIVDGIWLAAQLQEPVDLVLSSGQTHSIKEVLEIAFGYIGKNWKNYVEIDQKLYRPAEVNYLCGDSTKARKLLQWQPQIDFETLITNMVINDIHLSNPMKNMAESINVES